MNTKETIDSDDEDENYQEFGARTPNYYRTTFKGESPKSNRDTEILLSLATRPSMEKLPNQIEKTSTHNSIDDLEKKRRSIDYYSLKKKYILQKARNESSNSRGNTGTRERIQSSLKDLTDFQNGVAAQQNAQSPIDLRHLEGLRASLKNQTVERKRNSLLDLEDKLMQYGGGRDRKGLK